MTFKELADNSISNQKSNYPDADSEKSATEPGFSIHFQTKTQFLNDNPAFTKGGIDWIVFHQKMKLLEEGAIAYFGSKILINSPRFKRLILDGKFTVIGGTRNDI